MPAKRKSPNGHFSISYGTIGALVGVVTLIVILMTAVKNLAMKSDVDVTWQRVVLLQDKVQALEVQMARYFGAKPATAVQPTAFRYAVYHQYLGTNAPPPARRTVLTLQFIQEHNMVPSVSGGYLLMGADEKSYSLDDTLAALIEEHDKVHATDDVQLQMKMKVGSSPKK
jgi:hypothetical protein